VWSDVVDYFDWLGGAVGGGPDRPARLAAACAAIRAHEAALCDAMINGTGHLKGLAEIPGVTCSRRGDNPAREGLVSITVDGRTGQELVETLRTHGIRPPMCARQTTTPAAGAAPPGCGNLHPRQALPHTTARRRLPVS